MQPAAGDSSVTDEEFDALLASRPFRLPETSDDDQHLFDLLADQAWPSSSSLSASVTPLATSDDWEQRVHNTAFPEYQYRQPNVQPSISPSSSFSAQFLSGTQEHGILLQALEEQRQRQQQQQQQQQYQQQVQAHSAQQQQHIPFQLSETRQDASLYLGQHQSPGLPPYQNFPNPLHSPISIAQPIHSQRIQSREQNPPNSTSSYHSHSSSSSSQTHRLMPQGLTTPVQHAHVGSPHSDAFSSPEEQMFGRYDQRYTFTPSRTSQTSLQSLPEQGVPLSMSPSPSIESQIASSSSASKSPNDLRLSRRSSTEIRAIRQRRQVRRTYAGPSPISSVYSPTSSIIADGFAAQQQASRNVRSSVRPTSASGPQMEAMASTRPRAGTASTMASFSSHYGSSLGDGEEQTMSASMDDFHPSGRGGIPSSLSAELAGLGLHADQLHGTMSNEDVQMDESMQRTSSASSSSTTTRRRNTGDPGELSLFSQATSSSSAFDDSVASSAGDLNSSNWIHGKDTPPPSTPPRGRIAQSTLSLQAAAMESDHGGISDGVRSYDYSQTWPRSNSDASSGAVSSAQNTPSLSSSSGFAGHDSASSRVQSPNHLTHVMQQQQQQHAHLHSSSRLAAPHTVRIQRTPSSTSVKSLQQRQSQSLQQKQQLQQQQQMRQLQESSQRLRSRSGMPSTESLRSDAGPSRLSRGGTSSGTAESSTATDRSKKRWSTSVLATPTLDLIGLQRRRAAASRGLSESDQYDDVSAALDTLRAFLRQRERPQQISPSSSSLQAPRSSSSRGSSSSGIAAALEENESMRHGRFASRSDSSYTTDARMSSQQSEEHLIARRDSEIAPKSTTIRRLRHPPAGPLPPRGSLANDQDVHSSSSASTSTNKFAQRQPSQHTLSPSSSFVSDAQSHISSDDSLTAVSGRMASHKSSHASASSMDRFSALESLADRIRKMRETNQRLE